MQIWAETGKSALPIRNYSHILYQFLMFTQNLKRSRTTYLVDYSHPIDANSESYSIVDKSFGDYGLSKIYVTHNYICLSEEGNNYQYIYSVDFKPDAAHYAPQDDDKIHKLGNDWYLITPN